MAGPAVEKLIVLAMHGARVDGVEHGRSAFGSATARASLWLLPHDAIVIGDLDGTGVRERRLFVSAVSQVLKASIHDELDGLIAFEVFDPPENAIALPLVVHGPVDADPRFALDQGEHEGHHVRTAVRPHGGEVADASGSRQGHRFVTSHRTALPTVQRTCRDSPPREYDHGTTVRPERPVLSARDLARQIARDGEGATRLITVTVTGGASFEEARLAARTVASSSLVKSAVHGGDPNWGRIVCALGYSGADLAIDRLDLSIAGLTVFTRGAGQQVDLAAVRAAFEQPEIMIHAELGLGDGSAEAWGCDLSEEYVRINADYTT